MKKNKKQEIFNSSFLKKSKKAELTTQQIVILIVLLMSFAVILFFLFRLNLGHSSQKDICHNSVVMKGNPVLSKGDVSLNCKRSYVCVSEDGSCEAMTNPEIIKVKTANETYKALADEMADCWWMFGEGKIDYLNDKALRKNYCSICNQLAFDDSIKQIPEFNSGKLSKDELYDYLAKTPLSQGKETYAEYFFGTSDLKGIKNDVLNNANNTKQIGTFGEIDLTKSQFVLMGIVSEPGKFYKIAGTSLVVLALLTPLGWVGGAIIIGTGIGVATYGGEIAEIYNPKILAITVKGDGVDNAFISPTIIEANSDEFNLLQCKDIMTLA